MLVLQNQKTNSLTFTQHTNLTTMLVYFMACFVTFAAGVAAMPPKAKCRQRNEDLETLLGRRE
jgi:hypothetical protein